MYTQHSTKIKNLDHGIGMPDSPQIIAAIPIPQKVGMRPGCLVIELWEKTIYRIGAWHFYEEKLPGENVDGWHRGSSKGYIEDFPEAMMKFSNESVRYWSGIENIEARGS